MCDYFMRLGQLTKSVNTPISPNELISLVEDYFANGVRSTIIISVPSNTLKDKVELLKELKVGVMDYRTNEITRGPCKREVNCLR